MNTKKKDHLPLFGVGPLIVLPQVILTIIGVTLEKNGILIGWKFDILKIPMLICGIVCICLGIILWHGANFKCKIDIHIQKNELVTDGVYSIVRNPIYSAFYLLCLGVILIENNLILLIIPVLGYVYMTIILKNTEEKWLREKFGKEYIDYCKDVNRVIPWFAKNKY